MNIKDMSFKILKLLIIIILLPLLLVFILVITIIDIFSFLFEYPMYRRSLFYRNLKLKYKPGITKSQVYRLYNYIIKNNLDIEFLKEDNDYIYIKNNNKIYLFPWFEEIEFDDEAKCYISETDNDDLESLEDSIINEITKIKNKKSKLKYKVIIDEKSYRKMLYHKEQYNLKDKCKELYIYNDMEEIKKI